MTTANAIIPASGLPVPLSPEQGLKRYLQEISKFPVLSQEEEQELARRWHEDQDMEAAHKLVTSHLRLVAKIAFKYRGYGLPVADLIAEGNIGMMQAIKRFEPSKGFRLSTYAMWWIRAAIQEYILRSWSLVKIGSSAAQKRLFFNLRKLKKKINANGDQGMTDEQAGDIAQMLDVKKQDVVDMDQRMSGNDVYLNSPISGEGQEERMAFLADESASHEEILADKEELIAKQILLQKALETLNERERDILKRRRLKDEPDTLEALSQVYDISRERVRQIEVRAFEKLQKEMVANN
ncbi:MAG: RNA polymerase sigma factor RpoH [Rickettsiales bacterium]